MITHVLKTGLDEHAIHPRRLVSDVISFQKNTLVQIGIEGIRVKNSSRFTG